MKKPERIGVSVGKGIECKCGASSSFECGCDNVDWTDYTLYNKGLDEMESYYQWKIREILEGLIKEMQEKRNPYPESVFKGDDFKFYRQIYDNSRIEMIEITQEELADLEKGEK